MLFAWINYYRNFSMALGEDLSARLFGPPPGLGFSAAVIA